MTTEHLIDENDRIVLEYVAGRRSGAVTRTEIRDAVRAALDALAVFEEAHTPTNDEREARAIVRRAVGGVLFHVTNFPERAQSHLLGENMGPLNERITEAVLAALGLPVSRDLVRRVDVALSVIAHEGGDVHVKQALDYVKAAFANQSLILDFVAPEPQGEPSDAQVRAAVLAWRSMGGGRLGWSSMRVALRAALRAAAPQGEASDAHDEDCEAEYVVGAAGNTDCGCRRRASDTEYRKAVGAGASAIAAIVDDHDMPWNPEVLADAALRAAGVTEQGGNRGDD